MTKTAKVTYFFFRPTVLHDHAASRLVKKLRINAITRYYYSSDRNGSRALSSTTQAAPVKYVLTSTRVGIS